jgi:hypothetical protein
MKPITYADLDHQTTNLELRISGVTRIGASYAYESIENELEEMSETLPFTDETVVSHDNPLFLN